MEAFANWLQATPLSNAIQSVLWIVPAVQSLHILAIGVLIGAFLMVDMRVLGVVGRDQTIAQVSQRYAPWFWAALIVLLCSGLILILGEPRRELLSLSFWVKMTLLAIGVILALSFHRYLRANPELWNGQGSAHAGARALALMSTLIWLGIIFMGRFIAFDAQVWGSLSPQA
jgi:hypothetical protein